MTTQTPDEIRSDLPPDLEPSERDSLVSAAIRLQVGRLVPSPDFRGKLSRNWLGTPKAGRMVGTTPGAVRVLSAAYAASVAFLLAITAVGLAGTGPFAPG